MLPAASVNQLKDIKNLHLQEKLYKVTSPPGVTQKGMTMNHINHVLPAKTHTSMYLMHKYWARKPHNIVSEYIRSYSEENEIILDPFCGSGVTAIEALKTGRKVVALDLDPMALFITRMTAMKVDVHALREAFQTIEKNIKEQIAHLYKTTCRKCGNNVVVTHTIWKKEKNLKETPQHLWYICERCGDKSFQKVAPEKEDREKLDEIERTRIPFWYPDNELVWNSRINVHKGMRISDLFTKRNLIALSVLLNEIEGIENEPVKNMVKFIFSSSIAGSSRLVSLEKRGGKKEVELGGWAYRGYWIPSIHFEVNVWNSFENRYKKIIKGKEESNSLIKDYKEAEKFNDLTKNLRIFLINSSVLDLSQFVPPNSIDYIFTDPPYGDAVPYLELDYLWASWMRFEMHFEEEIVVSDSPIREKNDEIYEKMLNAAFVEIFRVLKPNRYMTVTFHSTKIKYWNSLINAVALAGFELEKITYQPPARASPKGLLHPYGSAVGDYYLRFKKPERVKKLITEHEVEKERYELIVVETAKKLIAERGEPIPYQFILNGIIPELDKNGVLLKGVRGIEEIMREHLEDEFMLVEVKNNDENVVGHKWWLRDPTSIPYLEQVPLSERVEKAVINVLNRKIKASYDDIQQEILTSFPNSLTPDNQSIIEILEEYAKKTRDGKWQLRQTKAYMDSIHTKMIYYLAEIGKKLGFSIHIGLKEQNAEFEKVKLSDLCSEESPTLRFIPLEKLERIKQIDVIWYRDGEIKYEFEVENTTSITEAIVRGSSIPTESTKKVVVIPREREEFLYKRLQQPIFFERPKRDKWSFMFYEDVEELFSNKKTKIGDINKIKRIPKPRMENQKKLIDYF